MQTVQISWSRNVLVACLQGGSTGDQCHLSLVICYLSLLTCYLLWTCILPAGWLHRRAMSRARRGLKSPGLAAPTLTFDLSYLLGDKMMRLSWWQCDSLITTMRQYEDELQPQLLFQFWFLRRPNRNQALAFVGRRAVAGDWFDWF